MEARRIGNGKGVDAIANVKEVIDRANMFIMAANKDRRPHYGDEIRNGIRLSKIARDTAKLFLENVASGVIDDGDVMYYIIESKDVGFMDKLTDAVEVHTTNLATYTEIMLEGDYDD